MKEKEKEEKKKKKSIERKTRRGEFELFEK